MGALDSTLTPAERDAMTRRRALAGSSPALWVRPADRAETREGAAVRDALRRTLALATAEDAEALAAVEALDVHLPLTK